MLHIKVNSSQLHITNLLVCLNKRGDSIAWKDERKEAKKYGDSAIGTYKVNYVHGVDSLKLVGHNCLKRTPITSNS